MHWTWVDVRKTSLIGLIYAKCNNGLNKKHSFVCRRAKMNRGRGFGGVFCRPFNSFSANCDGCKGTGFLSMHAVSICLVLCQDIIVLHLDVQHL